MNNQGQISFKLNEKVIKRSPNYCETLKSSQITNFLIIYAFTPYETVTNIDTKMTKAQLLSWPLKVISKAKQMSASSPYLPASQKILSDRDARV